MKYKIEIELERIDEDRKEENQSMDDLLDTTLKYAIEDLNKIVRVKLAKVNGNVYYIDK